MTAEMLRSDAPCAIARTLMPAAPSVPKNLPALPGMPAMSSPTTAMIAQPVVTPTRCTCEVHERDVVDAADALDARVAMRRRRRDLGARMRRVERVADPYRDAAAD